MNGFERVVASLDRPGAEVYPLDLCGTTVTGIASSCLSRVLAARGLPPECSVVDTIQGLSAPPSEVLVALGSDTLHVGIDRIRVPLQGGPEGSLEARDGFGVLWRRGRGELYFSQASAPLSEGRLSDALKDYRFPEPDIPALSAAVDAGRRDAARYGLYPILDRDCAGLFEMSARLRGAERLYLDFYDDPEGVDELAGRLLEYKLRYWEALIRLWGKAPAGITEADDYGSDLSLLVSPHVLRERYISRYGVLLSAIKAWLPGVRVMFHSCGAVREIIPDLIEAGIDALNPLQFSAVGMEREALKRDFGARLSFWGGAVDTQRVLPYGSPAEVRAQVLSSAATLGAGGGFVTATVHNIQADVPTANAIAYLDAAAELKARGAGQ
jgi:uroporphyrinogen decarboxylase